MKTLFIKDGTEKIDLGDGFWIEIPAGIAYGMTTKIYGQLKFTEEELNDPQNAQKIGETLILALAIKWNLKEEDGSPAELNKKNLLRLPIVIVSKITNAIIPKLILDKKKLPTS